MKKEKRLTKKQLIKAKLQTGLLTLLALLLVGLVCGACGAEKSTEDLALYDNETILLHGLTTEDVEVAVGDLKKMPKIKTTATASRYNGEKVKVVATGTLLENLMEKYGKSPSDYEVIRFSSADGYSIAVDQNTLANNQVVLAYYDQGKLFSDLDGPVRLVIPNERAMYWVRMLARIDFESEKSAAPTKKIVFFETALKNLPIKNYEFQAAIDSAITTGDLIKTYADGTEQVENVYMLATDGLLKNETKANFLQAHLKYTGKNAPMFVDLNLPEGMYVNNLISIHYGNTAFFFVESGLQTLELKNLNAASGIALSDILKKLGSVGAEAYAFKDAKGNQQQYEYAQLANALVYCNDSGVLVFDSGISDTQPLEGLLSIELIS